MSEYFASVLFKEFYGVMPVFRSSNHLEFVFVYGVREWSHFIDLNVAVKISQHHLMKRLSFLHCILLPPLSLP